MFNKYILNNASDLYLYIHLFDYLINYYILKKLINKIISNKHY